MTILTISNGNSKFPLSVSANGRYLLNTRGDPFLLFGDSPQGLLACLTPAQMATYMSNRAGYGINCLQVHLIAGTTFGGANNTTFPAQDGTTPFTTTGDISTPREAYFAKVDAMLSLAASYGMAVMLTAAETIDAESLWQSEGNTKCYNFGAYLGARYASTPNLIWNFGNDFQDWASNQTAVDAIKNMMDGILSQDSNHLLTDWLDYDDSGGRESTDFASRITFDSAYTYYPCYARVLTEYARSPAMPVYLIEANYEGEALKGFTTLPLHIRKQAWWVMTSGACGHFYCNGPDTYKFSSGWETRLATDGIQHLTYLTALLSPRQWWLLVPDNAHGYLTAGYGTYDGSTTAIDTNDYATCAYLADESLVILYMPSNRTMTVNGLAGAYTCRWYDPTDGSFTADAASPVSSWPHDFSRSGANAAGDHDWTLVLEV